MAGRQLLSVSVDEARLLGGRYQLIDQLGAGGLGTVWRALDTVAHREVAIKRLRAEYTQVAKLRRRMRREARAIARLEHPNIVRLYDLGEDDGAPFLAMEIVVGESLGLFARRKPPIGQLLEFVDQVLGALAFSHARGVIHRDITPENILITKDVDGRHIAKLVDFGFARVEDDSDQDTMTRASEVFGTPVYMAPEQATGDFEIGPSTDLYSLGIVVWELLSGAAPFIGLSGTELVMQHICAPLPRLSPRTGYVLPGGIEQLLRRALEKEPHHRFDSAAIMRRALRAVLDEEDESTLVGAVLESPEPTPPPREAWEINDGTLTTVGGGPAIEELPVVGREAIQGRLWADVTTVCRESRSVGVLLEGRIGLGKSRLCQWLREGVVEGGWMTVAHGQCGVGGLRTALLSALGVAERSVSHRMGALNQVVHDLDPATRLDTAALGAFLWPSAGACCPLGRVMSIVDEVVRLLARRRPLFLCLDDLHLASAAEVSILDHLVKRWTTRAVPVFFVGARRVEAGLGVDIDTSPLVPFLKRHHYRLRREILGDLDDVAIASMVEQALVAHPRLVERVVEAARGNPLYANQAVQYWWELGVVEQIDGLHQLQEGAEQLPRRLIDLMRARQDVALRGHSDPRALSSMVEWMALLGPSFSYGLAEATARRFSVDAVQLEMGLDALVRLGVLVDRAADAFAFAHALVREAVLEETAQKVNGPLMHADIAEAKRAYYADGLGPVAAQIAQHHFLAGEIHSGAECLLVAAEHARAVFQQGVAEALYSQADRWLGQVARDARTDPLRADLLTGLAQIALESRDADRAGQLAGRVLRWAHQAGDQRRAARALLLAGEARVSARDHKAEVLLEEARQLSIGLEDYEGVGLATLAMGRAALVRGDVPTAERRFESADLAFGRAANGGGQAACKRALGELALRAGSRDTAMILLKQAATMAEASEDHLLLAQSTWRLGELHRHNGHSELAATRYRQAAAAYEAVGNHNGVGRSYRGLADALRVLDEGSAEWAYRRSIRIFQADADLFQLGISHSQLGRLLVDQGALDGAQAEFERAIGCMESFEQPVHLGLLNGSLARVCHRKHDLAARDHWLQSALRIDGQRPLVVSEFAVILEELAMGVAAEGHGAQARALMTRAVEIWEGLKNQQRAAKARRRLASLR